MSKVKTILISILRYVISFLIYFSISSICHNLLQSELSNFNIYYFKKTPKSKMLRFALTRSIALNKIKSYIY